MSAALPHATIDPRPEAAHSRRDVGGRSPTKTSEGTPAQPLDGLVSVQSYVAGFNLAVIATWTALACFLMLANTTAVSTAIPRITDEFRSLIDVGWYASKYHFGMYIVLALLGVRDETRLASQVWIPLAVVSSILFSVGRGLVST